MGRGGAPPLPPPPRWQPPPPCRPPDDRRVSAFRLSVIGLLGIAAAPSSPRPAADFQNTGQQRSAARRPLALRCSSRQPWMSRASEWDRARRFWTDERGSLRRLASGQLPGLPWATRDSDGRSSIMPASPQRRLSPASTAASHRLAADSPLLRSLLPAQAPPGAEA